MTDKVQKIKDWISKEQDGLMDAQGNFEYPEHEGAYHILCNLDAYIDSLQEEPVSDELVDAANNALEGLLDKYDLVGTGSCLEMFKLGAQWQEEQFEKNRLKHCDSITNEQAELEQGFVAQHLDKHNRIPTFLDAIEYGMNLQKVQMIANAIETTVHIDAGGYPYIPQIELYDYDKEVPLAKEGDKYKVILIKEDKYDRRNE